MGTVSKLVSGVFLADPSNYSRGRSGYKICKITPHIMAGILTAEQCAVNIFGKPNRQASANYCIGYAGEIVCNVYEEDRSWCSSNRLNDWQAITIEISNSAIGGEWPISDAAWNSLIELCIDICTRYNFRLEYDGTPNGSLTRHNMFANKTCPGAYLQAKLPELARIVNSRLDGQNSQPEVVPVPEPPKANHSIGEVVTINGIYTASNSIKKLNPSRKQGTITKIIPGAHNPYLLDNGNLGWTNDGCIVSNIASAPAPSSPIKRMKVNARSGLNVRNNPNGNKVGALTNGTEVDVFEEQNGWSKIGDGQWVSSQYLIAVGTSAPVQSQSFAKGDRVKIKTSATNYVTGQRIPSSIKNKTYTIMQKENGKSLLREIMSWVYDKDLTK